MITKIINGKIILPDKVLENNCLYYKDGTITAVTDRELPFDSVIDAGNNYVSPGFIDTHVHGGGGYDFSDGGADAIINAADTHLKHGTTSILPTTLACSYETLTEILEDIAEDFVGGDFASDFAEVEQNFADILAQHIRGKVHIEAIQASLDTRQRRAER